MYRIFIIVSFFFASVCAAQTPVKPIAGWQHLDLIKDRTFGVSTERMYNELLKNKNGIPVTVAVIDGGVDVNHPDLQNTTWKNLKEIPGNKRDEDKNGYIDDVHGWNFMANKKGSYDFDNVEEVRILRKALLTDRNSSETKRLKAALDESIERFPPFINELEQKLATLNAIVQSIGKQHPKDADFRAYKYRNPEELAMLLNIVQFLKTNPDYREYQKQLEEKHKTSNEQLNYWLNLNYNPRSDRELKNRFSGNGEVERDIPGHGTHAAGIIGAERGNGIGIEGFSNQIRIMALRVVPFGHARDNDIANSIRYAADNGAKVINMSYVKPAAMDPDLIEDAIKYAMEKDVLIVHAAGNDGQNKTEEAGFPSRKYSNGEVAKGWIEVGASGPKDDNSLMAWFSNYGQNTVDLFAPGADIYSTMPGDKYDFMSGTSMAAPVVSGVAAIIRSYYPKLTAVQVKDIIMKSVIKRDLLKDRCISGGVVNAYNALKLAETY